MGRWGEDTAVSPWSRMRVFSTRAVWTRHVSSGALDLGPPCWHRQWGEEEARDAGQTDRKEEMQTGLGRAVLAGPVRCSEFIRQTGAGRRGGWVGHWTKCWPSSAVGRPVQDPMAWRPERRPSSRATATTVRRPRALLAPLPGGSCQGGRLQRGDWQQVTVIRVPSSVLVKG